jgi:hypothetical protein
MTYGYRGEGGAMKNSLRDRIPLTIKTHEEMRKLWVEFKDYMRKTEYALKNQDTRLTGAALFVDFLCGIKPEMRNRGTSYLNYPDKSWPND